MENYYKENYELGSIVIAKRTYNGETITGKFGGFHLLDKSNPKSIIVGVVHTPDGSYDVEPYSIKSVISEDERIRKEIIKHFEIKKRRLDEMEDYLDPSNFPFDELQLCQNAIAWLEKQGEKSNIPQDMEDDLRRQSTIQVLEYARSLDAYNQYGKESIDKNITWLKKQDEQKTVKVESKFKVGDWVVTPDNEVKQIDEVAYDKYWFTDETFYNTIDADNKGHLWTIQDAKEGDILAWNDCGDEYIFVFDKLIKDYAHAFIGFNDYLGTIETKEGANRYYQLNKLYPTTNEQRGLLFSKMKEAGYEWNAEKKKLKKIEQKQNELPKGEDYGIDGLWQAIQILEHSLGEVDGRQSDDGILEHKCAIEAVNRLYKQKPTWSEEDERKSQLFLAICDDIKGDSATYSTMYREIEELKTWLKSFKERMKGV